MKPHNPSGSSLSRAEACPGSHALPAVHRPSGEAAQRGNTVHSYLEHAMRDGRAEHTLSGQPQAWADFARGIDLANLRDVLELDGADKVCLEQTFAFDWTTGAVRILGESLDRDYSGLGPTEIPGTADVIVVRGTHAICADYKTGRVFVAADSTQLRFLAMCAAKAHDCYTADAVVLQWSTDDPLDLSVRKHFMEGWDLDAQVEHFKKVGQSIADARADVDAGKIPILRESEQCKYCSAYRSCPAKHSVEGLVLGKGSARRVTKESFRRAGLSSRL